MLSILVIVCDIFWCIGFVSLISFQHYRWCCYQSFDVFRVFFFLSFLVILSFYYQLCPFMLNLGENWSFDVSSEFYFLFFSFLVLFFYCKLYPFIFNLGKSGVWYLWLASHKYHIRLFKLFYFLKYFLYCGILSNFFKSAIKTKTQI
jgi:hypothetical protein